MKHTITQQQDADFRRILTINPGFDKRSDKPSENYGIHGCEMRFVLMGPEGAVQFVLFTNWMPLNIRQERDRKKESLPRCLLEPMPADLGFHSNRPMYEGHSSMGSDCPFVSGECFYDGSGLNAENAFDVLTDLGMDGLWNYLNDYYAQVFEKAQEQQP